MENRCAFKQFTSAPKTKLAGQLNSQLSRVENVFAGMSLLETQVELFWETEKVKQKKPFTEERQCEEHFHRTVKKRHEDGRFVVSLPKRDIELLGDTSYTALRRLIQMEKRLNKKPELRVDYYSF